jgi:hypothetical protein
VNIYKALSASGSEGKAKLEEAIGEFLSAAARSPDYAELFAGLDEEMSKTAPPALRQMLKASPEMRLFLARNPGVAEALKKGNPALSEQIDSAVQQGRKKLTHALKDRDNSLHKDSTAAMQNLQRAVQSKRNMFGANHAAKTEVLKFVQGAAGDPVKLRALSQLARHDTYKPLIAGALGSAMGGASWIRGAGNAAELSKNATTAFLHLVGAGALDSADAQQALNKLGPKETDALRNPQSPFWQGLQGLSVEQRTELADCFGPLPQEIYTKSREYFQAQVELESLEGKLKKPFIGGPLENLDGACSQLGVKLLENGGKVPELADGTVSPDMKARIERELDKPQVKQALDGVRNFWKTNEKRIQELRTKTAALKKVLQPYVDGGHKNLTIAMASIPESEFTTRRDILAGKPGATFGDCWDTMTKVSYKKRLVSFGYVYGSSTLRRLGDFPRDTQPDPSLISRIVNNAFIVAR